MPVACAVVGCKSKGYKSGRKFFSFPMIDKRSKRSLALTQARQLAWLKAINRSDFFTSQFGHSRVCDLHLISGKSVKYLDVENPDWVPTLRLGYEKEEESNDTVVDTLEETPNRASYEESIVVDPINIEVAEFDVNVQGEGVASKETQTFTDASSIGTQTDGTITGMSPEILISYEEQIKFLEEMLVIHNVTLDNFRGNDKKTNFFTGISHFATLEALYEILEPKIKISKKLTKFQILMIVLSRLRLNLSFRYLSYQFNVSIPTISSHFHKCLLEMHAKLKKFVYWPDRDSIKKTTPLCFKNSFGDSITVIIDCFEIYIEKPGNHKALTQCFSTYKHAYTIKYLIGITPQGFIAFISKGYGGRCSNKFVTEKCGFMDKVKLGDVVMADRGFLIEDELKYRGVELNIPAFTRGKALLHPRDIESTRSIANVRIHVERIIGQLRLKFTLLHQYKFPITLIKKAESSVNVIDQILTVCSALSNLCSPVVCKVDETL